MSYAEGYPADPLTSGDLLNDILEDTKRGNEPVPPYLTAKDVRCMAIDLQRLRFVALEATRPPVVTDEVVERVARALCFEDGPQGCGCVDQCKSDPFPADGIFMRFARAALASMPAAVSGGQSKIMRLFPLSCFASSPVSRSRPKASIGAEVICRLLGHRWTVFYQEQCPVEYHLCRRCKWIRHYCDEIDWSKVAAAELRAKASNPMTQRRG